METRLASLQDSATASELNARQGRRIRSLLAQNAAALALRDEPDSPVPPYLVLLMLVLHLIGLAAFWLYYHQPVWLAIPTLAVLMVLPLLAMRSRRSLAIETLAPLFLLYLILIIRVIAVRVLLLGMPYQDESSFADLRFIAFQVEGTAAAVFGYVALAQTARLVTRANRQHAFAALAVGLGILAAIWFAAETIGHRTRGVTGTDPYVYVQMAVDLADRGTPLHRFPLFSYFHDATIPWYPLEHMGYKLFGNLSGEVASVWPVGGSVWLAAFYRLFGEEGLYLATPVAALLALIAAAALVWEFLSHRPAWERIVVAAAAVALFATSWEQVDRTIVPLVDVEAQLFSVLAILFALRGTRANSWLLATLTGICLGIAYWIRHTQLLLVVPIIVASLALSTRDRVRFLVTAAIAALVVALPDLWYHQLNFGSWLTPESHELALFSPANLLSSMEALNARFSAANEFGFLIPFLIYGCYRAGREDAHRFAVLATWVVVLVGFHLLYSAVKLRDVLPEYPALILLTSYGMVRLAEDIRNWANNRTGRRVAAGLAIYAILLMPALRDRLTIPRPFEPARVTFGYVTAAQRDSFNRIAEVTSPDAVIGSTLNSGPIDLYAQRATFRLGEWSTGDLLRFVDLVRSQNRPVYLLDDSAETSKARQELSAQYSLRPITVLDVPLFGIVEGTPGTLWQVQAANKK